ncbi:MAG: CinA family nicotinamide mononucleotide deamidase-related protein [Bacteroidales bacterium]|nr:CinA family nicotinamide mononucleotide deamidase-related protein [Bacteroidales bacterium]
MKIAIIPIGDELLIGQVTDTNSGMIARHIAPYGWEVEQVNVVGDDAQAIRDAIERAFMTVDVVLTTGGLGPTRDDITKGVLCSLFGGELQEDPEVLANVRHVIEARGLRLNHLTSLQAMVPTSCRVIQNAVGTAPIMWFERPKKCADCKRQVLVAMPGVPFETRQMFTTAVFPQLLEAFASHTQVEHHTLIVTDISESALAEHIRDWENALPENIHLAYLPQPGLIRLRLDAHLDAQGDDHDSLAHTSSLYFNKLVELCKPWLLYSGDKTPAEILLERLGQKGLTVATAESCTGGNIAHQITEIPGASAAMLGGVVAYCNSLKTHLLGVSEATLESHGAVSEPTVREMAEGVCRATDAKVGIATSGIAGPTGAVEGKPVGTVCMGVCVDGHTTTATYHFPGDRQRVIDRATRVALIMAIRALG